MSIKSDAGLVAKNLLKVQEGFVRSVNKAMSNVSVILNEEVEKNISLTDHSLSDLRRLGHPYARGNSSALGHPIYQVHKQSGRLLNSKFFGVRPATVSGGTLRSSAFVGLDDISAPHAVNVIFGTSKMIPRPVLNVSRDNVSKEAKEKITKSLKNLKFNFRT